jgi:hypothetical protein
LYFCHFMLDATDNDRLGSLILLDPAGVARR